ncbi:WXG100 family type VII secretion target [Nocardia xishanensis]
MSDQPGTAAFAVVPDHVTDAGRFVQEAARNLINGVRAADVEVDALMSTWRGAAATAYGAGWDELRAGALEVLESLADMAELLGVVAARVTAADLESSNALGSLNLPPVNG